MKKIAALTTALVVSITMLSTISVSAKSVKVPKAKITKLQSTKPGNLTIKIKKIKKVSGYKVKISQNKKFKKSKTYKIKKNQKTIKGLKQGKKYFVKARAYKKIKVKGKSKTVYGKWSKVKSMKIKVKENKDNEEPDDNTSVTYKFDEEKDKERRAEIKDKIGIDFSENVNFFNYSCRPYWSRSYDESTGTYITEEYPEHGIFEIKIRIQEGELRKIIKDIGFRECPISSIPPGVKAGYDCDWWDLKESQIKNFYSHPHSLRLTYNTYVMTVWQYIIIASEKDNNGYLTVYMELI